MFPKASVVFLHYLNKQWCCSRQKFERFIFFSINDLVQFRKDLGSYCPRITSAAQTIQNIKNISNKVAGSDDVVSTEIGFSRAGLRYLGERDNIGDPHFDQGPMKNEKDILGDLADYDRVFNEGKVHGVILVTAKSEHWANFSHDFTN
jgi:hypothetical protein